MQLHTASLISAGPYVAFGNPLPRGRACPTSLALDTRVGALEILQSPEGTNVNSRGRSAALRSAAHGKQSVRRPTLEGLNELCGLMTFENQSSTPFRVGSFLATVTPGGI